MSNDFFPGDKMSAEEKINWLIQFKEDERIFEEFYKKNLHPIRFYAEKLLNGDTAAKDIVQESFLKIWKKKQNYDSVEHLKNSLYLITRNACLNHLKSLRSQYKKHKEAQSLIRTESIEADPELAKLQAQTIEKIYKIIDKQKPNARWALILSVLYEKPQKEVAGILNISPDNAGVLKSRLLTLLKKKLHKFKRGNNQLLPWLLLLYSLFS